MNSTEDISKYSDNNSHYRSPALARRATTELDEPSCEKPIKKGKKWTLSALFRRRKKEVEIESSASDEEVSKRSFLQRRKKRKDEKSKKRSTKTMGHFDHIVVLQDNIVNGVRDQSELDGIFSEPTFGSSNSRQFRNSLENVEKKSRRDRVKARVEAIRDRLKNDSSSDEGSQQSATSSSVMKFKSDESLNRKETRKTRSARTERHNRRLTKEEEQILNREAEIEKHRCGSKSDIDTGRAQINRWIVVDKPLKASYSGVSTIPPSHSNIHRTTSNILDNQRLYNNTSSNTSPFLNQKRKVQTLHYYPGGQRSSSYDCNINRSSTPANEENIIQAQFPIGKPIPKQRTSGIIQRVTPPPPPPRDPQRRLLTSSVLYENCRPMSYAFEIGNQHSKYPTQQQFVNANQNYRSNSEDHIARTNPQPYLITRPASATPDSAQQRFIRRHTTSDQYKYFAEKTPRSRKPIHIKSNQIVDQPYLSDSQVLNQIHNVHVASEFWKQKDLDEVKRMSQQLDMLTKVKQNVLGDHQSMEKTEIQDSSNVKKDPPIPPVRRSSRQSSASSIENNWFTTDKEEFHKKEQNLEQALNELEAIYNSLKLGDEELLDRAEERDISSAVTEKLLAKYPENDSDCVDGLHHRQRNLKRTPDKLVDDMAFRRLNKPEPSPLDLESVSRISYLLATPVLGDSADENDNISSNSKEPDITLDDVVYRNIKHAKNTLKITDPQPPFGVPLGPITSAANSDYLHAVADNRPRSRFKPQKSPDLVKDDLAFRALRKDQPEDCLNNNVKSDYSLKRKRAIRSISANIYNLMHPNVSRSTESDDNEGQSLTDIADTMEMAHQIVKESQNKITRRSVVSDSESKSKSEIQQKIQVYIPLSVNQKPPLCPLTPDRKSSRPPTKESTPNRMSPAPQDSILDQEHLEDLLTTLAREARETSEKLGNDLKRLDEQHSRKGSGSNSPINGNVKSQLSDLDAVSEHAKLCEKLLEGVSIESEDEPKIYKSIANVVVTKKEEEISKPEPDYENVEKTKEEISKPEPDYENIDNEPDEEECNEGEEVCCAAFNQPEFEFSNILPFRDDNELLTNINNSSHSEYTSSGFHTESPHSSSSTDSSLNLQISSDLNCVVVEDSGSEVKDDDDDDDSLLAALIAAPSSSHESSPPTTIPSVEWYGDLTTLALACSYSLAFLHQIAMLDLVTLLGLVLTIVTIFAAFVL